MYCSECLYGKKPAPTFGKTTSNGVIPWALEDDEFDPQYEQEVEIDSDFDARLNPKSDPCADYLAEWEAWTADINDEKPKPTSKCDCGAEKTYGKDATHSPWCSSNAAKNWHFKGGCV